MAPKSEIWLHFDQCDDKKSARCRHCGSIIKTSGNTSNLRCHLQHRHINIKLGQVSGSGKPLQFVDPIAKPKSSKRPSSPIASTSAVKVRTTLISNIDSHSSDIDDPDPQPVQTSSKSTIKQSKIDETFKKIRSYKQGDINVKITQAIVYMICVDAEPVSIVEHKGFRRLLKTVAPLYVVPSRKTIRTAVIDKYNYVSSVFKAKLADVESYSFTTDIWTDSQNRSFLSFTIHFFDSNKIDNFIEKGVLGIFDLHERHTAQYIADQFDKICEEWSIVKDKTIAVVTDSAPNIVKAVEICFGKKHIPCFAHTLNLIATKGIENVPSFVDLLKTVKTIVSWFHQSVTASDELRKLTEKKLVQDVTTRWNSTYDMIKRFLELRPFINDIVNRITTAPPMTSALEMEILQDAVDVLQPLHTATLEISSNQYLTSSLAIPIASSLLQEVTALTPNHDIGKDLKASILNQHKKRFGSIEQVQQLAVSTLLDPRFKREYFNDKLACAKGVTAVCKSMEAVLQQPGSPTGYESSSTDSDRGKYSEF